MFEIDFILIWDWFLNITENDNENGGAHWRDKVLFNDYNNPTKLKATKLWFAVETSSDNGKQLWYANIEMTNIFESIFGKNVGFFSSAEDFSYAYLIYKLEELTIQNVIFAACGVFLVLCFLINLKIALFIICIVAMIDVNIFGWMYIWDIDLTSVSFAEIVMGS